MWINLEILAVLGPIIVVFLGAIGFLIRRWLTGQSHIEDHESVERTIRLKQLLADHGMSLQEARELRDQFKSSRGGFSKAEAKMIATKVKEAEERERATVGLSEEGFRFEDTTVGMGIRASAELEILEGSLDYAIREFSDECSPCRKIALQDAQDAWLKFRDSDAALHSLLAEGGTMASLLYLGQQIARTEERIKEIRLMQADANL